MGLEVFFSALENLAEILYPFDLEKVDTLINHLIH